jgi:uridylate kinase
MVRYKRILIKLSGASMASKDESLDFDFIQKLAKDLREIKTMKVELGIVVGGGNIIRGRDAKCYGIKQDSADKMGMVATFINAIALSESLSRLKVKNKVLNIFSMGIYGEDYKVKSANKYLKDGYVVIFAGGTGKVGVTNDTNAALRAQETKSDVIFKATDVDGVYDKDPQKYKNAKRFDILTYKEAISKKLKVMDEKAFLICRKSKIPIVVFDLEKKNALKNAVLGKISGSVIE